jgi:hypothetical protein
MNKQPTGKRGNTRDPVSELSNPQMCEFYREGIDTIKITGGFTIYPSDPPVAMEHVITMPTQWPREFDPSAPQPQWVEDERVRQLFAGYARAWRDGNSLALLDALEDCRRFSVPPPNWLVWGIDRLVLTLLPRGRDGHVKGRRNPHDHIHFRRYSMVSFLWQLRMDLALDGIKLNWREIFAMASKELKGTIAEGGADVIKASYERVKREYKAGRGAHFNPSRFESMPEKWG